MEQLFSWSLIGPKHGAFSQGNCFYGGKKVSLDNIFPDQFRFGRQGLQCELILLETGAPRFHSVIFSLVFSIQAKFSKIFYTLGQAGGITGNIIKYPIRFHTIWGLVPDCEGETPSCFRSRFQAMGVEIPAPSPLNSMGNVLQPGRLAWKR